MMKLKSFSTDFEFSRMDFYKQFGEEISKMLDNTQNPENLKLIIDGLDLVYEKLLQNTTDANVVKVIGAIYDLTDIYYDAIIHGFLTLSENYSIDNVRSDLIYARNHLQSGEIIKLLQYDFVRKVDRLK